MTSEIPSYIISVPELVNKYCPQLIAWAQKTKSVKSDGAINEIPLPNEKRIVDLTGLYINTRTQRVDAIEFDKIMENLKIDGGFSHATAGTIDTLYHELTEIDSSPDGMHRLIMAYICGVLKVGIQRQNVHPIESTENEMIQRELDFFKAKNERNSKVKETSKARVNKLTGNMTPEQKELDLACIEAKVHVNDYGVSSDSADLSYKDGHGNMMDILTNQKSSVYLGVEKFVKHIPLLKMLQTGRTQLDGAIAKVCDILGEDAVIFKKYLKSEQYKTRNKDFWTGKCQHGAGMETATIRLALCFNEWYRAKFNENVVKFEMFDSFLDGMNNEANHFIHSCLIEGNPVDKVLLNFYPEEQLEESMV